MVDVARRGRVVVARLAVMRCGVMAPAMMRFSRRVVIMGRLAMMAMVGRLAMMRRRGGMMVVARLAVMMVMALRGSRHGDKRAA